MIGLCDLTMRSWNDFFVFMEEWERLRMKPLTAPLTECI